MSVPLFRFTGRSAVLSSAFLAAMALPAAAQIAQGEAVLPASVLLDPVVVSANLTPTPVSLVGSAVTSVGAEELEARQTRLVSDVLRKIPGVAVNRTGPVGQLTQVRLRGSEGNQTLVVIDGIRVNDPSAGSEFDFAHLLAEEVERVEVLRGPQSALYGSDAIGGVISITTRRGEVGRPVLRLRGEGGSFGTGLGSLSVSGGEEAYDFIVSAAGITTDGVSAADERRGNTERDGYRNGTGFAKLNLRPSEILELSLVGRYVDAKADTDAEIGGLGAVDADRQSLSQQLFGRAEGRLSLRDGRWEHVFGTSYARHDREFRAEGRRTSDFEGETRRADYQTNVLFDTPGFFDASHVATFALQHERNAAISNSAFSSFDRTIDSTGYVGQFQSTLAERLTLTTSARHDANELFRDADTYRLTGAYSHPETGTKLRASQGTGVKNPTLFELFGFTETFRGNPDLSPECGRGWDAGVDQSLFGGMAVLEVTYYEQRITDLIQGTGRTSVNLPGASRIDGVELGLTMTLLDGLTARAAYTRTNGEDARGEELVRRPRNTASVNLDYRFLEDERANLNLGIVYNGAQKDWAFDADWSRRVVELDPYVLVNLAGSYRLSRQAEIYGRVENLLDERYQEVFSYGTPGRAAYAGLKLTF